ncbi:LysM domain-containing protein [Oleiagrimonas sp.]|jgi:tetratricopeptide (TPR) repeat protein|uniref:LysM peptidoglycan-binding domain-containing protein n=1 Tax=Oleiagrimonas sp. TaxID=2010330 RepID=UPI00261D7C27|nr:LysM domain-containing protein [Oleiagrimonas sp.]MDA3915312.1 LysM domain-containing protein [Oleiagrimonas sp.]
MSPLEFHSSRKLRLRNLLASGLVAVVVLSGCAQVQKVGNLLHQDKLAARIQRTPDTANAPQMPVDTSLSLKNIINNQLVVGHYTKGRQMLGEYLHAHPEDHAAKDMMRQLTVDPHKMLGQRSVPHVVQPGESYSTLAEHYLGDSSRFLILARYNDSENPSLLRVGQVVRLPVAAMDKAEANPSIPGQGGNAGPADESPAKQADTPQTRLANARALQDQSLHLLDQGQKSKAMARLGQALQLDPTLPPDGSKEKALRKDLIASYHQRAIVLYRDQKLNQAIALWDQVLAIDPNYEPAVIYRARAKELKSRLKQL